ncbi:hypothetical protein [Mycobacteroides abscessus]|uniref:hypothetical protein n=1 Tax=Mycobacteroides abscessus TaxID=36809 RepID=UPI0009A7C791|nr:hypothetical protein [Mycobacteroides abscessus]SKV22973.1 Uncharacterised protein [Mycobacteroides abscessus subsp. abscessus]
MAIEKLRPPYEVEIHRNDDGDLVKVVIEAVGGDGNLNYEELREATRSVLDHVRSTYQKAEVDPSRALDTLIAAHRVAGREVSDEYLARLAVAYEACVPFGKAVSTKLAKALGISVNTMKGHIGRARSEGFLSPAEPGKEGGQATTKAHQIIVGGA